MEIERAESASKCDAISKVLESIRHTVHNAASSNSSSFPSDPLEPFMQLMDLRSLFRDVAFELETKRELARVRK